MLCIKEFYAPGDSRTDMDYDGDALDKNTLQWCSILVKFVGLAIR